MNVETPKDFADILRNLAKEFEDEKSLIGRHLYKDGKHIGYLTFVPDWMDDKFLTNLRNIPNEKSL